ncbi:MAG: phospholipase D-like domain-containing protein, partial [Chloroflexota bacterium]|nr:phospholipase D-like domain-containing protein [Chloroflexota bacterium]
MQRKKQIMNPLRALQRWHRFSIKRLLLEMAGALFGMQVVIVLILQIITERRKRHRKEGSFPHPHLSEVSVEGNSLQIYDYGADLFDAMFAAIDAAQESIYLETYIWKDDAVGQDFKEHLARKADQGVDVYVVFDAFANMVVPHHFKVFPSNIHTLDYRAFRRPWQLLDPRRYALDHRKLLIVDGSTSFIGGYNIGSLYATRWRDTHLRIVGQASADLAQSFTDFWKRHAPKHRRITRHYP